MFRSLRKPAPRRWTILTVWLALALAPIASAQTEADPPGYGEAIDGALRELSDHNFQEARALFWRAHAILPSARTLRGLGIAEFALRNYGECIRHLEAALASPVRPLDAGLRVDAEQLLARANDFVARYTLDTKPQASRVLIDGVALDVPPDQPLLVQVGDHVIEVQAAGYQPERLRLSVKGGEKQTLTVLFTRPLESERQAQPRARPLRKNPWLWTAIGVVAAGAATGTAIALSRGGAERADPYLGTSGVGLVAP